MRRYRIGEMASLSSLSERTIRYYEEQGLIKAGRSEGGQRWYADEDLVYLRRIIELKGLGFSLVEIRRIFELKDSDRSGNLRRKALLSEYRKKLDEDLGKLEALQKHIDELEWHIHQLEKAEDGFTECPGALCASCQYRTRCTFFRSEGEKPSAD